LSQFKKYHPPGNLKFNYLGIFQSLKLRILMENILLISHRLNFTQNTLGCYGLSSELKKNLKRKKKSIFKAIFVSRKLPIY